MLAAFLLFRRPDPDSSHFTGFHAVLVSIVPIMIFSLCVVGR